ncbi:MAG: hypothetical protein K2G93_03580 [Rikenella sp.]|nr:hypothetical protein [Rikenella sp.]
MELEQAVAGATIPSQLQFSSAERPEFSQDTTRLTNTMQQSRIPAPGLRGYEHGKVRNVGFNGCNWSSSVTSAYAYYLYFHHDGITTSNGYFRAHGLPTRCLQE